MPSRVGKMPIQIPSGVQVKREAESIHVKGPKGEMKFQLAHGVDVAIEPSEIKVSQVGGGKQALALHGTTRAVLANMVTGVTKGFSKVLEIQGTGYRAQMSGKKRIHGPGPPSQFARVCISVISSAGPFPIHRGIGFRCLETRSGRGSQSSYGQRQCAYLRGSTRAPFDCFPSV